MVIDHIGVAVESIEGALPFYLRALGLQVAHTEIVASQNVRVAFLQAGPTAIELLEPAGTEGPLSVFLKTRGPGLHHMAFAVEDIAGHMKRLSVEGLPPMESAPKPGARGHRVCFLHPKLAHGVLVELVEA